MASKVYATAAEAVADIADGATLAVGGFGLCGIPDALIEALAEPGSTDLEVFSNNCGVDDHGLGNPAVAPAGSAGSRRPTSARTRSSPGSTWPANSRWS